MNSNNYIRKIDDLGRIVIPKEVRNRLKIGENENILISCDDKKINISKYSDLDNYQLFLSKLSDLVFEIYQIEMTIYDRQKKIYSNYNEKFQNIQVQELIKDSTNIGKVIIYSNNNNELLKLSKLISRIIILFLSTT